MTVGGIYDIVDLSNLEKREIDNNGETIYIGMTIVKWYCVINMYGIKA